MTKDFTPAPWNIERLLPNGSTGFNPYLITANLIVGSYEIAYITESENGEADARLIAAAPRLYATLERNLEFMKNLREWAEKKIDGYGRNHAAGIGYAELLMNIALTETILREVKQGGNNNEQ